jgi:hypothetical protein
MLISRKTYGVNKFRRIREQGLDSRFRLKEISCCITGWSLTLREESRLRVFENRILRRIFGPKMGENGEWRRL